MRRESPKGSAVMAASPTKSHKGLLGRFIDPRHVAFWTVIGSMTAVVALVLTLASQTSPSNKPASTLLPAHSSSTSDAPQPSRVPTTAPAQASPSAAAGTELAHYQVTVAVGYGIDFTDSSSRPVNLADGSQTDLEYLGGVYLAVGTSGQVSVLNGTSPSYQACLNNTAYASKIIVPPARTTICFTGPGVIASSVITAAVTQPVQSLTFDVTVWRAAGQ